MGFYFRKSINVGPLRFNLSKSGVGVSAGVKGLRFGTGPRGNYIHMGCHGISYRATLPSSPQGHKPQSLPTSQLGLPIGTHDPLKDIESADVSQIVDSSSAELLKELNSKRRKMRLWPWALFAYVFFLFVGLANWPAWLTLLFLIGGAIGIYVVYQRDLLAKTAVLFYDFDPDMEKAYGFFHEWAEYLASCARAWHIEAEGNVRDRKYHAGASSLVRRKPTFIKKAEPPYVKTNIETVAIGVGRQVLHFFPDRILVYDRNGVGAVSYHNLELTARSSSFIEDGGVPNDAQVVDKTWRYVNKSGGPDRRFKDNYQLPICLYDELAFTSRTGLNELIQVSRCNTAEGFIKAVEHLASMIPRESPKPTG